MAGTGNRFFRLALTLIILSALLLTACDSDGESETKAYKIGVMIYVSIHEPVLDGFKAGMTNLGYVEGENITYLYNGIIDPTAEATQAEAQRLMDEHVDMFLTAGSLVTREAQTVVEGTDIPVVFCSVTNPVGGGYVESISHPGGNLTGTQVGLEIPKAFEMLVSLTQAEKVYVPYNPTEVASIGSRPLLDAPAASLGVEIVSGEVSSVEEAVAAIETLPDDIDAIFRIPSPTLDAQSNQVSQAAITRGLALGAGHPLDEAALFTLSTDFVSSGEIAAELADQIFDGVKPADLPVRSPDFHLTLNLQTAAVLGIEVPEDILRQANKIIREN